MGLCLGMAERLGSVGEGGCGVGGLWEVGGAETVAVVLVGLG